MMYFTGVEWNVTCCLVTVVTFVAVHALFFWRIFASVHLVVCASEIMYFTGVEWDVTCCLVHCYNRRSQDQNTEL